MMHETKVATFLSTGPQLFGAVCFTCGWESDRVWSHPEAAELARVTHEESVEGAGAAVDGASSAQATRPVWLHSHMEGGCREVVTRGDGYGCPKSRKCWFAVPDEETADWFLREFAPTTRPIS